MQKRIIYPVLSPERILQDSRFKFCLAPDVTRYVKGSAQKPGCEAISELLYEHIIC